jgi:transcriptional regulator with XRE-family HTH domain
MVHLIAQIKNSIRYRMYRRKKHFSQKEAALKLGLKSAGELCRWETGVLTPSLINICKLLLLYDITFEELFHDLLEALREQYPELTDNPHVAGNSTIYE